MSKDGGWLLTIRSRTADEALPLEGVRVSIRDQVGHLLYLLTTDRNGETKQVSLEALDRKFSLDPSYTGNSYSSYILDPEKEGYTSLHIVDVHIFDGETASLSISKLSISCSDRRSLFINQHSKAIQF